MIRGPSKPSISTYGERRQLCSVMISEKVFLSLQCILWLSNSVWLDLTVLHDFFIFFTVPWNLLETWRLWLEICLRLSQMWLTPSSGQLHHRKSIHKVTQHSAIRCVICTMHCTTKYFLDRSNPTGQEKCDPVTCFALSVKGQLCPDILHILYKIVILYRKNDGFDRCVLKTLSAWV